jgi:DNA-binding transcriptional LysR family regulator
MELELRHLRALCAIADAGSIGQAASGLGCSQQAMSTQLRRIETHLGSPVFERDTVGVRPTRYGVEVVARMRTELPDLVLTVSSVYQSSQIVELLEKGGLDAAIGVDYPGLELRHSGAVGHRGIVTEPSFVALPAGHRLKHRPEIALADLAEDPWFITPDDGAGWPGVFYAACEAVGFTPAMVHEFLGDRLQLLNMIAEGLGVSVVQATTRPIPGVVVRPLVGTPIRCRYLLAWRRQSIAEELVPTLFGAASASYRGLIARSPHFRAWATRTYHGTLP